MAARALKTALFILLLGVDVYKRQLYGRPPGPIDPVLLEKALGSEKPAFVRPGDQLAPGMETARTEAGALAHTEEDVVTLSLIHI